MSEIPEEDHVAKEQPVEEQPVEEQPVEEQPVEEQPVEELPVEEQPADEDDTSPEEEAHYTLPSHLFANWPPDLLDAWEQHQLPSLHDLLTTNERLASEVRRQNQELRRLADAANAAAAGTVATAESNARLLTLADGLRSAADAQQRRLLSGLIEACDSAVRHHCALDEDRVRVLALVSQRNWLGRPVPARAALERSLQASCDGARLLLQRLRQELDDLGAERLMPTAGEPFDPAWMRCTGRAPGALDRVITLERDGWKLQGHLIRPADVLVGTPTAGTTA